MNQIELDCLLVNGSIEELKRELQVIREARKILEREDARLVARGRLLVEALSQRVVKT